MAGRSRTASSPSSTLMLLASYTPPVPGFKSFAIEIPVFSNPHGHDHVSILVGHTVAHRAHFARALLILQIERDPILGNCAKEVEEVLGIEPDFEVGTLVFAEHAFLALSGFDGGGEDAYLTIGELDANGAGALVGELRN